MVTNNIKHHVHSVLYALLASCTIISLLFATFFFAEPTIGHGQTSGTFYIRQSITDESSFSFLPVDVTMDGPINGVTGGNATGTASFIITSNNSAGYTVDIDFYNNAGNYAMLGDMTGDEAIRDYSEATSTPSYNFVASTSAQFAYTITSSTTLDTGPLFLHDGANNCGVGGTQTAEKCWMTPSTTAVIIVDTDSDATTGASSTLQFRVHVPSGAVPVPQAETYTATATLSLIVK